MKDLMLDLLNPGGLLTIILAGFIAKAIAKFTSLAIVSFLKSKTNKLISKYLPLGIEVGDFLKNKKTNPERLYQAVLTVENKILTAFPKKIRPWIDKIIDSSKIALEIERELNKKKIVEIGIEGDDEKKE